MLECVKWLPAENKFEAVFGYNNPSKSNITVPPENSTLSCNAQVVAGQVPTVFKPGRVFSAFSAKFDCPVLTWTVTGPSGKPKSVTASGSSTACTTSGNIKPVISSPGKNFTKIGSELSILPNSGVLTTNKVYQIEQVNGQSYVFISLYAVSGATTALLTDLKTLGLLDPKVSNLHITGWLPIAQLSNLNGLANLDLAMPVFTPLTNVGATTTQGDRAQRTDLLRTAFGVQGQGIKIGVLSDSYNARLGNGALLGVRQGDLPGPENPLNTVPIQILRDLPPNSALGTDEGRAMLEIIHDVAPKATLAFRTGFDGPIDMAQGIRDLKAAGCNIILDDITYIDDPFFQDGIVGQAVDEVAAQGVAYFSAAGNFGELSYQGVYTPVDPATNRKHNFGGGDVRQRVFLPEGAYTLGMQWYSATGQDLDFYLTDDNGNILVGHNRASTFPFEGMSFDVTAGGATANIVVENASTTLDPSVVFKYIIFRGNAAIGEYRTGTSTITGHSNSAGAMTVGAVLYSNTPRYNVPLPTIASFSSRGGTPLLASGTPARSKPDFAAPNGGNTTVPIGTLYNDGDSFFNFFGTSAAAPHAAAAAALLMEAHVRFSGPTLAPAQVRSLLRSTALDMGPSGPDVATGYGFIRPDNAISTFATPTPIALSISTPEGVTPGSKLIVTGHYFKGSSQGSISRIKFAGAELPTTFISETELQTVIPTYTGNPSIQVCSPSTSIKGGDGGCSKPLYLFPKTLITIKANNTTKGYGDALPTFTATFTPNDSLRASNIAFTTLATDLSDVGAYIVTPSLAPTHPFLARADKYEVVYEPGILQIEKIALEIAARDVAITEGAPLTGFAYNFNFPTPVRNTSDRVEQVRNSLLQSHLSLQTNKVALVTEAELLNLEAIRNRSFLVSDLAETSAARVINATRVLNVSSRLLNEVYTSELNVSSVFNATYLMNAARVINAARVLNAARVINAARVLNTNTVGPANNEKSILILNEADEVLSRLYSINLITGYTLGTHRWAPASLLSPNVNVTYGEPANFFVNPIGTGVRAVKPILECVQVSSRPGYYIAHFYYENPNTITVGLPLNSENKLTYAGAQPPCFVNNTRIPTIFKPGRNYAFSVEFDGTKVSWNLTSIQGTKKTSIASDASSTSARCKTNVAITSPCANTTLQGVIASKLEAAPVEESGAIRVFPNPIGNEVSLDLSALGETEVTVSISDVLGKTCLKRQQLPAGKSAPVLNTSHLASGVYLLKIEYGNEVKSFRLVKRE
ncbi:S8 family serine peptidase [Rufibacter aurantiacus]|uniref:S8 family serine peptidase n=1 Tax=Rufibacter aurantiacus TaxID=2817374 RepID=UPI001B308A5C|nr:S8 family serine peptidase [Rufibacter aurantiacus]